jgi:voltage-gated potassium channel
MAFKFTLWSCENHTMLSKIANSPRYLVLTAVALLVSASAAYAATEHKGLGDSLYWALITATTVGYGDAYPHTSAGRVVAIVLVFAMVIFFLPMVTASMASKLIVNRDVFTHEEQEELKEGLHRLLTLMESERAESEIRGE